MPFFTPKTIRIIRTSNLYLSYFGLGLCIAMPGPTLMDLERNVGTDTQHISYIFAARSVAYLIGSILSGILFDRFNRQCLLIGSVLIAGVSTFTIPWWSSLWPLILSMVTSGIAMGSLDTGCGVMCLDLWTTNPGPFLQALHFMFGAGAFIAPLVAEPFLSPTPVNRTIMVDNVNITTDSIPEGYYIINAFAIAGGFMFLVSLSYVVMFIVDPKDVPSNTQKARPSIKGGNGYLPILVIGLSSLMVCGYVALEMTYGQYISYFAVNSSHKYSKSTASYLASVFYGAFMTFRGLSIFIATCSSPFMMLFFNVTVMNLVSLTLVCWGDTNPYVLWGGSAIIGSAMASVYPSAFAWIEKYTGVSNKVAALFQVFGSIGGTITPILLGATIEKTPMSIMYVTMGCCMLCGVVLLFQWRIRSLFRSRRIDKGNEFSKVETVSPLNG